MDNKPKSKQKEQKKEKPKESKRNKTVSPAVEYDIYKNGTSKIKKKMDKPKKPMKPMRGASKDESTKKAKDKHMPKVPKMRPRYADGSKGLKKSGKNMASKKQADDLDFSKDGGTNATGRSYKTKKSQAKKPIEVKPVKSKLAGEERDLKEPVKKISYKAGSAGQDYLEGDELDEKGNFKKRASTTLNKFGNTGEARDSKTEIKSAGNKKFNSKEKPKAKNGMQVKKMKMKKK